MTRVIIIIIKIRLYFLFVLIILTSPNQPAAQHLVYNRPLNVGSAGKQSDALRVD